MKKNSVILCCPTLREELLTAAKMFQSQAVIYFLPEELHSSPKNLKNYLQDKIDHFENVDTIFICPSGCGGGTIGLKATTANLVLARTRDCLDILLSENSLQSLHEKRDIRGIYLTKSWMEFSKKSEIDLEKLNRKLGPDEAKKFLRNLYKNFKDFYIIDTGCYDVQEVKEYLAPLLEILDGNLTVVRGEFTILKKMVQQKIDDDFILIKQGESVPNSFTFDKQKS